MQLISIYICKAINEHFVHLFQNILNIVNICQYNFYCQLTFYMLLPLEIFRDYLMLWIYKTI